MAARGRMADMYTFDEALGTLDRMQDPADPTPDQATDAPTDKPTQAPDGGDGGEGEKPNPHDCDCDGVCHDLNNDRLPKAVTYEKNYLSYENFPVLCRDASAIMLPPRSDNKPQKKYVCKEVFDCCRKCNWLFYKCLATKPNTYGFCMRGAYKCMCDCIDKKSFKELPYNPVPVHTRPPQTPPPQTNPPSIPPPQPTP
ncbi:hypothetical protein ACROYT_G032030 [Oculina patagonica]